MAHAALSESANSQQWKAMCAQKTAYTKKKEKLQDELDRSLAQLRHVHDDRQARTKECQKDETVWYVVLCEMIYNDVPNSGAIGALRGKDITTQNGMVRHRGKTPASARMLRQKILQMAETMAKRNSTGARHASKLTTLTPRQAEAMQERRRREETVARESPEDYVVNIFHKLCNLGNSGRNVTKTDFQNCVVLAIMPTLDAREVQEIVVWFMGSDETISCHNFVQKIINAPGGGGMGWGIEVSASCSDDEVVNFFFYSLVTYAKTRAAINMHNVVDEVTSIFQQVDEDESGQLSVREVDKLLFMLNLAFSDKQKHVLRTAFDGDGNGSVSFIEFMTKMNTYDDAAWSRKPGMHIA
jgi:hypothetical protein